MSRGGTIFQSLLALEKIINNFKKKCGETFVCKTFPWKKIAKHSRKKRTKELEAEACGENGNSINSRARIEARPLDPKVVSYNCADALAFGGKRRGFQNFVKKNTSILGGKIGYAQFCRL